MTDFSPPSTPPSQWSCLLRNLGAWQGSFTRLSPEGIIKEDIPSLVTLNGINENQTVQQTIQKFSIDTGEEVYHQFLEYSTLNRSILFFETGAFSQGSIQFGPFSEFGAELGLIHGDRRLRLVQMFDTNSQFTNLILIREHRQNTPSAERPPLTIDQLLGEWQGEAITLHPDLRPPTFYSTRLSIQQVGDRFTQRLTTPTMDFTSTATQVGSTLRFEQGKFPIQVLLLPDGASSNTPLTIPRRLPFFLEVGWLITDTLRQRLIRSYSAEGEWIGLTLVTEQKVIE